MYVIFFKPSNGLHSSLKCEEFTLQICFFFPNFHFNFHINVCLQTLFISIVSLVAVLAYLAHRQLRLPLDLIEPEKYTNNSMHYSIASLKITYTKANAYLLLFSFCIVSHLSSFCFQ